MARVLRFTAEAADEMAHAFGHEGIAAYQLHETANFTWLAEDGEFHGSRELLDLCRRLGFAQA